MTLNFMLLLDFAKEIFSDLKLEQNDKGDVIIAIFYIMKRNVVSKVQIIIRSTT